jgi:tetratricopeptide (TPR) repeat protein
MPHSAKPRCIQLYRLITSFVILLFVTTLNNVALLPGWAALGPMVIARQDFLSLVKDSDVVALIQINAPECNIETNYTKCNSRINNKRALRESVHFQFLKVFRVPSWCEITNNSPQVMATFYKKDFQDQKQYVVFLQASSDKNQWWNVADKSMFIPVDQDQIVDVRQKCQGLFSNSLSEDERENKSASTADVSLSEFLDRFKIVSSSIPEMNKHELYSTEKYLKLCASQVEVDEIMRKWKYRSNSDPKPFIKKMSKVIKIQPAKEPLLQRAWAYLFLGRVQEAIDDIDTAMRTELRDPDLLAQYTDYPNKDGMLGVSDAVKRTPVYNPTVPDDLWSKHYQFTEYISHAYANVRAHRLREAEEDCNAASKCLPEPGWDSGCAILPLCLLHMGKFEQAKAICDQLLANRLAREWCKNPGRFLYVVRAHAYIGLNDYEHALADGQKAYELFKNDDIENLNRDEGPAAFSYRTMMQEPDCSPSAIARAEALEDLKRYVEAKQIIDAFILQESEPRYFTDTNGNGDYDRRPRLKRAYRIRSQLCNKL